MGTGTVLLELIGDTHELQTVEEFRVDLIGALQRALPVDWISVNDIGPDPGDVFVLSDPLPPTELLEHYVRYADQNPLTDYYHRTGDARVMRFSDLVTQAELHQLELHRHVYAPLGIEYQMSFTLPHAARRILGVALSRRTADFTHSERDLLEQARPFLIQGYRNAVRYSAALADPARSRLPDIEALADLGITERQAEVLRLLCTGAAEREIAEQLGIGLRTVEKHLERAYRTLGASGRAAAAAIAWRTVD